MLSLPKTLTIFPSQIPCILQHRHAISLTITRSSGENENNIASDGTDSNVSPPVLPAPDTVEIRFKRGSKRRRKQQQLDGDKTPAKQAPVPKDWDSMTLTEKAIELYVGEKGALFWLNKFAYASIYIVIGGWIVFRFVGPALNLYQLDTPPLAPTSMFKG